MNQDIFFYKGEKTLIESNPNDIVKDICNKFISILKKDPNCLYFLYNGKKLNTELSISQIKLGSFKNKNIVIKVKDIIEIQNEKNELIEINQEKNIKNKNDNCMNEMIITYKRQDKNNKIRLFGYNFVNRYQDICKIIYKGKDFRLQHYFYFEKNKNILEIKLRGVNQITDWSYMFAGCSLLFSLPNIS